MHFTSSNVFMCVSVGWWDRPNQPNVTLNEKTGPIFYWWHWLNTKSERLTNTEQIVPKIHTEFIFKTLHLEENNFSPSGNFYYLNKTTLCTSIRLCTKIKCSFFSSFFFSFLVGRNSFSCSHLLDLRVKLYFIVPLFPGYGKKEIDVWNFNCICLTNLFDSLGNNYLISFEG